jgi:hypothetical protein
MKPVHEVACLVVVKYGLPVENEIKSDRKDAILVKFNC